MANKMLPLASAAGRSKAMVLLLLLLLLLLIQCLFLLPLCVGQSDEISHH